MQHVKGCNTTKKKDLCILQNPFFFISKAEHHPKQPSLGTLWSFTLEQPLLSLLKLTFFIINRKQKLSKKVALLQLQRRKSGRAGTFPTVRHS